jgi:septation ring formation regulator EzrA
MSALMQADMIGFTQLDIVQQETKNIRLELTNVRRGIFRRYDEFTTEVKAENEVLRASNEILKSELAALKDDLMTLKAQIVSRNSFSDNLAMIPEQKQCQMYFI